jgi:transporter family-2 protein
VVSHHHVLRCHLALHRFNKCLARTQLPRKRTQVTNRFLLYSLAIGAGFSVVVQQALNSNLRMALKSAAWAGFVSYFVGTVCMVLLALVLGESLPSSAIASRPPLWAWSGGIFGAIFIALAILLLPQIGASTFIVLLVAGQTIASLIIDHFGLFGLAVRHIDVSRIVALALVVGGVALIQR